MIKTAHRSTRPEATAAPVAELLMTRDALARLFTVTPGTIVRWARDGMPVATGGGQGRQASYRPSVCVAWRLAAIEAKYADQAGLDPRVERARRDAAQASLAEQLHRRRSGEMLEREDVRRTWSNVVLAIRSRLLALPQSVAAQCAQATDPAAVEQLLRDEVHSALRELASWEPPVESKTPPAPASKRKGRKT
jgi:phage terminase Nu1 subunit (DNA packaging protein)